MTDPPDDEAALTAALCDALARVPGLAATPPATRDAWAEEFLPFARSAVAHAVATPELRSLAWLFAYRLGDQQAPAPAPLAALTAWRDHTGTDAARALAEQVTPLLLDGYARAREDRARATLLASLGASLPVMALSLDVLLAVAAGPLDGDAARALVERAGQQMLRSNARGVVLDLTGLHDPDAATLGELDAIAHAATLLGAHAAFVAVPSAHPEAFAGCAFRGPIFATLPEALAHLARTHGLETAPARTWSDRLRTWWMTRTPRR